MIAPIDKIKALTTDDVQNLFGEDIINSCFEEAYKFVNSLITENNCYESLVATDLPSARYKTDTAVRLGAGALGWNDEQYLRNRRILYVNRKIKDISPEILIEASKIDPNISTTNMTLSGSIYYEEDPYAPKYYSTNLGKLQIVPLDDSSNPTAEVYFLTYPIFGEADEYNDTHKLQSHNFSTISKAAEHMLFYGIPRQAKELVYLQMALNLIQYYMANFVHDDEDTELSALLASQVAAIDRDRKEQLQFVVSTFGTDNMGDVK